MKCDQLMASVTRLPVLAGGGFDDQVRSFHISHRSKNLFSLGLGHSNILKLLASCSVRGLSPIFLCSHRLTAGTYMPTSRLAFAQQTVVSVVYPVEAVNSARELAPTLLGRQPWFTALQFSKLQSNLGWVFEPCILV